MKINKVNLTAGITLGACFACVPLWILELIPIWVIYTVWGVTLTAFLFMVTGVMRKIFPPKKK